MRYTKYTTEILEQLGAKPTNKSCQYIISSIEYINRLDKYVIPDSEMVYAKIAKKYKVAPVAIENSIRNAIQDIWDNKVNLDLMHTIFYEYNMDKRPCNMEFLMMLFSHIRYHIDYPMQLQKMEKAAKMEQRRLEKEKAAEKVEI